MASLSSIALLCLEWQKLFILISENDHLWNVLNNVSRTTGFLYLAGETRTHVQIQALKESNDENSHGETIYKIRKRNTRLPNITCRRKLSNSLRDFPTPISFQKTPATSPNTFNIGAKRPLVFSRGLSSNLLMSYIIFKESVIRNYPRCHDPHNPRTPLLLL